MNKTISTLLIITGVLMSLILLFITLAFGYVYFTVHTPESFTDGVSDSIDEDEIKKEIDARLSISSSTYGFNNEIITDLIIKEDMRALASDYFTDYYNAFINGADTFPEFTYNNDEFYNVISENTDKATRPELFETEENKQLLAGKYNESVESAIASLSISSIYSAALSQRGLYLKLTELGKYFIHFAVSFAVLFLLTAVFTIRQKRYKTAYFASLACFAVTVVFSVPFTYLSTLDLPAKLNVGVGSSGIYINAVYDLLVTKASLVYIVLSVIALVLFIAAAIWNAYSKRTNN